MLPRTLSEVALASYCCVPAPPVPITPPSNCIGPEEEEVAGGPQIPWPSHTSPSPFVPHAVPDGTGFGYLHTPPTHWPGATQQSVGGISHGPHDDPDEELGAEEPVPVLELLAGLPPVPLLELPTVLELWELLAPTPELDEALDKPLLELWELLAPEPELDALATSALLEAAPTPVLPEPLGGMPPRPPVEVLEKAPPAPPSAPELELPVAPPAPLVTLLTAETPSTPPAPLLDVTAPPRPDPLDAWVDPRPELDEVVGRPLALDVVIRVPLVGAAPPLPP